MEHFNTGSYYVSFLFQIYKAIKKMDQKYSPEEINFIVAISVVMIVAVGMAILISICVAWRRNQQLEDTEGLTSTYDLSTDTEEIWSVYGHYNPIVT